MRAWVLAVTFAAVALLGCAASAPPSAAEPPPASPLGSPFSDRRMGFTSIAYPLLLDRTDLQIGTTVPFTSMPTLTALHDVTTVPTLRHTRAPLQQLPAASSHQ